MRVCFSKSYAADKTADALTYLMGLTFIVTCAIGTMAPYAIAAEAADGQDESAFVQVGREEVMVSYKDQTVEVGEFYFANDSDLSDMRDLPEAEATAFKKDKALDFLFTKFAAQKARESGFGQDYTFKRNYEVYQEMLRARLFVMLHNDDFWPPTEEQERAFYEEEKENFRNIENFRFRHIFFKTVDEPEAVQKQAKVRAEQALERLNKGELFDKVAEEMSDSDNKGRVVGPFKLGKINPKIEEALLSLEVGQYSGILETDYGYEILRLEDHLLPTIKPFEQVRGSIQLDLRRKLVKEFRDKVMDEKWDKAIADYKPEVIEAAEEDGTITEEEKKNVFVKVWGEPIDLFRYDRLMKSPHKDSYREMVEADGLDSFLRDYVIAPALYAGLVVQEGYGDHHFVRHQVNFWAVPKLAQEYLKSEWEKHIQEKPITEEEARRFYEAHPLQFKADPELEAYEIVRKIPEHDESEKYQIYKAQKEAEEPLLEALERIKQGEPFEKLVAEYSESDTAKSGGYLGRLVRGMEDMPLTGKEAFNLYENEITKDVEKLKDDTMALVFTSIRYPLETRPFEDDVSQNRAWGGATSERREEFIRQTRLELADPEKVTFHEDVIAKIKWNNIEPILEQ